MPFPTSSFVRDGVYTDVRPLGRGAYGQVYYAKQARLGRPVAVKEALPTSQNFQDARAKFETEARVHAGLDDDNIISIYALEEDPQTSELYLVGEYANAGSLADHLRTDGVLSQAQAVKVTRDICAALAVTAQQGIVHCDIKPSNILLTKDQQGLIVKAKLGDFGIAQQSGAGRATIRPGTSHPGTPLYMAPEQSNVANQLDVRTDIYALGITLWEMLTRTDYKPLLAAGPPDLRSHNAAASPQIADIIRKAVQHDPNRRYQSPAEMDRDLAALPVAAQPRAAGGMGCARWIGLLLLVLLLLALGAGAATFWAIQQNRLAVGAAVTASPTVAATDPPATASAAAPPAVAATAVATLPSPSPPADDPTASPPPAVATQQPLLQQVLERGQLRCGVNPDLPGFGFYDNVRRNWSGFDVDFCRVVAAAVLGDANAVEFVPLGSEERWQAIRNGEVDVLFRNSTWTAERDTAEGVDFGPTTFHDGQALMVRSDDDISELSQLAGQAVCVQEATTSAANLRDVFAARNIDIEIVVAGSLEENYDRYASGECAAVTSDSSQLAAVRQTLADPDEHVILGELISREPLGPAFAEDDSQWRDVVSWAVFATIYAEELRVDQANVAELAETATDPRIRRLLGLEGNIGIDLGLSADFGRQVIAQVGNYGDIYDRNLGPDTPFALDRGPNKVWNLGEGGVLAAPPFR